MFWHKNKDLSRFVQNVCENVLLYLLKLFPFSYRNDFITEKYVFYIESIGKIVFVLSFCDKTFFRKKCPKNDVIQSKKTRILKRKASFNGNFEVITRNILLCGFPIKKKTFSKLITKHKGFLWWL